MRAVLRDTTFTWTKNAQDSFQLVKQLITESPALAMFDPALPTIVSTDASDYGVGGVLTQIHPDNSERTVSFASRSLSAAERKYSVVEKEALACVWATERWRTYLWGTKFTLRTDHQALTTLLNTKGMDRAGMRIARWSARLLCFNYDIVYRPGAQNHAADCLSRLPLPCNQSGSPDTEPETVAAVSVLLMAVPMSDFADVCSSCSELQKLRGYMTDGWPASSKGLPAEMMPYYRVKDELSMHDSLILRGPHRLVVPVQLRSQMVQLAHESHQGIVRTKQRLRDLYWWPKMDAHVQSTISACVPCQLNDKTARTVPAPLTPVPLPDGPWQKLAMDIVGPFETGPADCKFAITMVDYYSKWPEVCFAPQCTAATVVQFMSTVFSQKGNPEEIVTDNGPQFVSSEFSFFLKERDIRHIRTTIYHPEGNGAVERLNRVIKESILAAEREKAPWKAHVTDFLQIYRATPHATTGVSPFQLMYGRKMRTKLSVQHKVTTTQDHNMKDRVNNKQLQMKTYADAKRHAKTPKIRPGSLVRVRIPVHVKKGRSKFSEPFNVVQQKGPHSYTLTDGKTWDASHLSVLPETFTLPAGEPSQEKPAPSDNVPTRSQRNRKQPEWLKEYVT